MDENKALLLQWIEEDSDRLIALACDLIRAQSPNPPGETCKVAAIVGDFLQGAGTSYKIVAARDDLPNIVSSFQSEKPGRRLSLNGHMDVMPVASAKGWRHPPWSGLVADGKIWGRGATNMKCGLAIALAVYDYMHRLKSEICGGATFSAVSEEIILGEMGAEYLMEHVPEIIGDACLMAEPSGLSTIRFGQKGPMRLRFHVEATGAHGAFTHLSRGAISTAARLIADLERLNGLEPGAQNDVGAILDRAAPQIDAAQGAGAHEIAHRLTVGFTMIAGGTAKNMLPTDCSFVADLRLPVGMMPEEVLEKVNAIAARHHGVTVEQMDINPPAWCDPQGELVSLIQHNVVAQNKPEPRPIVSLGCTDARLWHYRGVPTYQYGPPPKGMGGVDEHVSVDDFIHVLKVHALTAYDYLSRS